MSWIAYLRQAYVYALEYMNDITWQECCEKAIKTSTKTGHISVGYHRAIQYYSISFSIRLKFPHPNIRIEINRMYSSLLLDFFPEARHLICEYTSKNTEGMSWEKTANFVRNELLKQLFESYKEETSDPDLTLDVFKQLMRIREFGVTTAWRYVHHLGFKFCDHKETYYNGKYENKENVIYRKEFTKQYFKYELCSSYLWVRFWSSFLD